MRALFLPLGVALALATTPAAAQQRGQWTRAWTSSPWQGNAQTVENVTLRAQIRVGAGGQALRLRLSNEYGDAPIRIGAASVKAADGRIVRVTFDNGAATGTMRAGAPLISDAVPLAVKPFELVEVSLFLPDPTRLTTVHGASGARVAVSAPGDMTGAATFAPASTLVLRPFVAGVDVLTPRARPVVVAYGDSITDNTGCRNDSPVICRWGDALGRRLAAAGKPHVVVTQAISGNRLLTPGSGPSALARFDRDVLAVPGVTHVLLLEGVNDIGNATPQAPVSSAELIGAFRQLIMRAHDRGIKIYASPILPYKGAKYYTAQGEAIRSEVNRWIRTSGAFDGVIDLERAVADPNDPLRLADAMQGGDDLHPNAAGETAMAEAVPLGIFR